MARQSSSDGALTADKTGATPLSQADLRELTPARVSLGRSGNSIATRDILAFASDHAQARDAVHAHLSLPTLLGELKARGLETVAVKSAAPDRATYLRRPDLGRKLADSAESLLASGSSDGSRPRLTIILADGLSALATDRNAIAVVDSLLPLIQTEWGLTPIVIAEQARVALGDEIGAALGARLTVMLIGERPGLSAADSLGAYVTWEPRPGRSNAERNCISNIRDGGLAAKEAAQRIAHFAREARLLQATGIALKDPAGQFLIE